MPTIQRRRPRSAVPPVVALTPEDNREFRHQLRRLVKSSASMIPRLADEAAEHSLNQFTRHWATHQRVEQRSFDGFRRRLSKRWGESLDKFHLLIAVARDFGGAGRRCGQRNPTLDRPCLVDVVTRLARSCLSGFVGGPHTASFRPRGRCDGSMQNSSRDRSDRVLRSPAW